MPPQLHPSGAHPAALCTLCHAVQFDHSVDVMLAALRSGEGAAAPGAEPAAQGAGAGSDAATATLAAALHATQDEAAAAVGVSAAEMATLKVCPSFLDPIKDIRIPLIPCARPEAPLPTAGGDSHRLVPK
jgi:hypothetical protein